MSAGTVAAAVVGTAAVGGVGLWVAWQAGWLTPLGIAKPVSAAAQAAARAAAYRASVTRRAAASGPTPTQQVVDSISY